MTDISSPGIEADDNEGGTLPELERITVIVELENPAAVLYSRCWYIFMGKKTLHI